MKKLFRLSTLALAISLPLTAHAHHTWMLPSGTVFSGNDPWVTVDAAVSNDLFFFEHFPLKIDTLTITAPDGSQAQAENALTGKYRSTFDLHLSQTGTYKLAVINNGIMASWKEDGKPKRWRGTLDTFAKEVPANAEELKVTQSLGRVETYVTSGKPDTKVFATTGQGLEFVPITHPNDLFAGETATFSLLLDGKPAADLKVEVIPGGARYRDKTGAFEVKTDAKGQFKVTWPNAGMYLVEAEVQDDKATKPATNRRAIYVGTFEVLPQ